jgi:hypothetical protein
VGQCKAKTKSREQGKSDQHEAAPANTSKPTTMSEYFENVQKTFLVLLSNKLIPS